MGFKRLKIETGPEEQNKKERLKVEREFPNYGDLFQEPDAESIIKEVDNRRELRRLNSIPQHVKDVRSAQENINVSGRQMIRVTVWFLQVNDPNFSGAKVFIKGYGTGNILGDPGQGFGRQETLPFVLLAEIDRSPYTTLLERTGEEVVIGVQSINNEGIGSDKNSMPTLTLTLD